MAASVLRTFLFAPGNHPRRVEKAFTLGADAVILDLEDAVAVAEKVATRKTVVEALSKPRTCKGYVRVNAIGTQWCLGDVTEVVRPGIDGIVLPKVESAADLRTIDWLITNLERERGLPPGGIDLLPIIETAAGFSRLDRIFGARSLKDYGGPWRVKRMTFGAADFTNDVGMTWTAGEEELTTLRVNLVVASRAAGIEPPIDTVWVDLKDAAGLRASVERSRRLGFQGRMCIHPDQVSGGERDLYAVAGRSGTRAENCRRLQGRRILGRRFDPGRRRVRRLPGLPSRRAHPCDPGRDQEK